MGLGYLKDSALKPVSDYNPKVLINRRQLRDVKVFEIEQLELPSGLSSFEEREIFSFMELLLSGGEPVHLSVKKAQNFKIAQQLVLNIQRSQNEN